MTDIPQPILSPVLDGNHLSHGFFTREGGVSVGRYKSLNTSPDTDDNRNCVRENRRRVAAALHIREQQLVTLLQVHSAQVVTLDSSFTGDSPIADNRLKGDALVTNIAGLGLGILTADCGPVLFSDPDARVTGAAHAGWRGALAGILENTVSAMQALGARRNRIKAVLGPCISVQNYEVRKDFLAIFLAENNSNRDYFIPSQKPDHFYFNLQTFITDRLKKGGIKASRANICTCAEENLFSYRRSIRKHESGCGRQISVIAIKPHH